MKQITLLLSIMLITSIANSQTVLNGDFEINSLSLCQMNNSNDIFNLAMNNCFAFGLGSEIDIQDSTCGYSNPANGNWFISLATGIIGDPDALSIKLSAPLTIGNSYQVSYYQKSDTTYTPLDSLQVGISLDSTVFGTKIHSSQPIAQTGWTLKTFSFISPIAGQYLTFSNNGLHRGWNFIDDIQLNLVTGVNHTPIDSYVQIYPNPTRGKINISAPNGLNNVNIFNSIGQLIYTIDNAEEFTMLNLELNDNGIYFVVISINGKTITKKLIVSSD